MASFTMASSAAFLFLFIGFSSLHYFVVSSMEFQVGGTQGWVVPPPNDSNIYNEWASKYRFQAGDSLRFKYRKDSVMKVNETDYKRCNSSHPNFFSNTGDTLFTFDYSGPFYFISGASGHCEMGQRMIVRVMSEEEESPGGGSKSSGSHVAVSSLAVTSALVFVQLLVLPYHASYVI